MPIKLTNISKAFDKRQVLSSFSAIFPKKGSVLIGGRSGAGKTTLLRIIAGLETPDSGSITGIKNLKKAFVFQEDRLFPQLTAYENVELIGSGRTDELLLKMELCEAKDKYPHELSGGMKRRVALARALAYDSDILLLDEALKGLDSGLKLRILNIIKEEAEKRLVIFVSHDNEDIKILGGEKYEV